MDTSVEDPRVIRRMVVSRLAPRQTHARSLAEGESLRLRVTEGQVWVTLEGDAGDHILIAGDFRQFNGPGLWVAEGIGDGAEFEIG